MIGIALGLVHNKNTALANRQQISSLDTLLTKVRDADGNLLAYQLTGLTTEHTLAIYQVIPFGVTRPNNINLIQSRVVTYGVNDSDKTGDHSRFFNYLLKRGTDNGADVVAYVRFPALFGAIDFDTALTRITTTRLLITRVWGTMASVRLLRLLRDAGRDALDESQVYDTALTGLRAWMLQRGLEYDE